MPACFFHPQIEETEPCAGCGRPFCAGCTADIMGRRLCEACKAYTVQDLVRPQHRHPLVLWALLVPIAGYLTGCLWPITSTVGLWLGWKALREIDEQPSFAGRSGALAAVVLSAGTLATFLLAVLISVGMYVSNR